MDYINIFGLRIGQILWNNKNGEVITLSSQIASDVSKSRSQLSYEELVPFGLGIGGQNCAGIWFSVNIKNIGDWELTETLFEPCADMSPRTRACMTILLDRICAIENKFAVLRSM